MTAKDAVICFFVSPLLYSSNRIKPSHLQGSAMKTELLEQFKKGGKYEPYMSNAWTKFLVFIDKYSIIVSGVVIYLYFLLSSFNFLRSRESTTGFFDFILQFDSMILLWVIAVVVIQLQKYRKQTREQEEYRQKVQLEFDRQRTKLQVLDEMTSLLQDNINNPLAIISVSSQNLHRKHESDSETVGWLDRIDTALQRVHTTINDIKAYQTQKIVQESMMMVDGVPQKPVDIMERIAGLAEANQKMSEATTVEAASSGGMK
jgi:signal transduction histidine kinase